MYILIQHTGNTMTDVLPNFKVSSCKQGRWAQNRIFESKMLLYLVQGYGKFFFQGVVDDHCGLFFSSKVDQMQDIVTGNPAVIKIVVHFNRWIIENVLALFLASTLWFPAGLLAVHYLYKIVYSNIDVWKYECSTYAATIPSWLMKRSVSSHTSLCSGRIFVTPLFQMWVCT